MMYEQIIELTKELERDAIGFTRKLIRTPSLSGSEKEVADLCLTEMKQLGYDEVFRDGVGNVVGIIKGTGEGQNLMLNSHMDQVDIGDRKNWQYDPYGAEIVDGYIHGRGACDDKGGLATQVYAGAVLKRLGKLKGDLILAAVVQEEATGMFGMQYFCDVTCPQKELNFALMVSSEATSLNLFLGHRGRTEIEVNTYGRTCHASTPERGLNAVSKMVPILAAIPEIARQLPNHPVLGQASLALTNITCSPGRLSILPDLCTIALDRRLVPGETAAQVLQPFNALIDQLKRGDPEFQAEACIKKVQETSYTGYTAAVEKKLNAWLLEPNHEYVQLAVRALKRVGQNPGFGRWDFATDASYVTGELGIPSIGYSPMEESYAHTPYDCVKITNIGKAIAGNAAIAADFCGLAQQSK
jgi:putative selenium metabolism hydrolase